MALRRPSKPCPVNTQASGPGVERTILDDGPPRVQTLALRLGQAVPHAAPRPRLEAWRPEKE